MARRRARERFVRRFVLQFLVLREQLGRPRGDWSVTALACVLLFSYGNSNEF